MAEKTKAVIEDLKFEDFFININPKDIPAKPELGDKPSPERRAFVRREINRCLGGVMVDGVFISGWLYWHLNHWWIRDDFEDDYGNIVRRKVHPSLRDNEWIVSCYLEECRIKKLGYLHIGVRQFGKSEIMASYIAYHATLFEKTQNVVVGGNDDDLNMIRDKIDFGIQNLWEGIKIPKIDKDMKKNMLRLGFKTKSDEPEVWSHLIVRNVSEGKKTEGPAGVTAKAFAIDEIGKFAFGQAFKAAKPAFVSKFGWRCVPILFGTGGSFDKGADAERYFYHPEANNFLCVVDPETGTKTAIFMSGLYRIDCKEPGTLKQFLIQEGQLPEGDYPNLAKLEMMISNKEAAKIKIKQERADAANDPDQTEYLKLVMYYPLTPQECFLTTANNFYNQDIARMKREKLERSEYKPMYVDLFEEGGSVIHKPSDKLPVSSYPTKDKENLDTPICILEHPIPNPPYALYVAGIDPYRFPGNPKYSGSLGAVYILKRVFDPLNDTFQDMFVAWYVGRPNDKGVWNNNVRLLLKYYNAMALCENDEMSFIDYMETKGEGHYLMDSPDFIREFNISTATAGRGKGVSRSGERTRLLFRTNFKQYMETAFATVAVAGSEEKRAVLGVEKINDPVLLMEIEKWNEDGNFDREVAASLAITAGKYFDKMMIQPESNNDDPRFKIKRDKVTGAPAGRQRQIFSNYHKGVLRKGSHKLF